MYGYVSVSASVSVNVTVEGASEEKGSCGMKLKAFDTVQICRTPTTEERQNKSTEVWQWDNDREVNIEKEDSELPGDAEGESWL